MGGAVARGRAKEFGGGVGVVCGVEEDVVHVEQQVAVGFGDDRVDEFDFAQFRAGGRVVGHVLDADAPIEEVLRLAPSATIDGGLHEVLDFAAVVGMLDALVTGDTLAMHIGIALGVPTVVLFGPSAPQEIELYGAGGKVVTPLDCAPCYRRECDITPSCMDAIEMESVHAALKEALERA